MRLDNAFDLPLAGFQAGAFGLVGRQGGRCLVVFQCFDLGVQFLQIDEGVVVVLQVA